jgi:hypothetical protein
MLVEQADGRCAHAIEGLKLVVWLFGLLQREEEGLNALVELVRSLGVYRLIVELEAVVREVSLDGHP